MSWNQKFLKSFIFLYLFPKKISFILRKNKLKELHQDLQTRQNELKSLNELLNSRLDRLTFRKASSEIRHSSSKDSKENMILIYKVAAKRKKILINDIKVLKDIEASSKIEKFSIFFN